MQYETLKQHVQAALREQWSDFSKQHPHLSQAVDETFWTTAAAESISDDMEFQVAMNHAQMMGTALDRGPAIVREFVGRWLKRIG